MGCDACGNVYVCDYASPGDGASLVYRISPDGSDVSVLIDTSGVAGYMGSFLANMDWGTGEGGWRTNSLYFAETAGQRILEVPIGVPSNPRAYP